MYVYVSVHPSIHVYYTIRHIGQTGLWYRLFFDVEMGGV